MKQHIENLILTTLKQLQASGELTLDTLPPVQIDTTKDKRNGDLASNIALVLAKPAQKKPRDIAEIILKNLPASEQVAKVEIAGPGFLNFFLTEAAMHSIVPEILNAGADFGKADIGKGKKILVEFVSSNPTGPLHVGHGRHAAYGAVVCELLETVGFNVWREYYVNDGGRQMDILAVSVWLRYLELCGEQFAFPANAYKGEYVIDMANQVIEEYGDKFKKPAAEIFKDLPKDEPEGGDKELYIDALIVRAQKLLGDEDFLQIFNISLNLILHDINEDLALFGVEFDEWFSERDFVKTDVVDRLIENMRKNNLVYEKDGAIWFRATDFKDDKDRVLQRANGQRTYFVNDLAYHISKFERGADAAVDIFGSDHHGYIPRMRAGLEANGIGEDKLTYVLMQFVYLFRAGEPVPMSTRSGSFVTLRELREEVGNDAARYFYVMRRPEQPVDFDLDLAKSKSNENPVYYVQYAHARICSVLRQMAEKNLTYSESEGLENLSLLTDQHELQLLGTLSRYQEMIVNAATQHEPHLVTNYLRELATDFHSYYNSQQFLVDDSRLRNARLVLIGATRQVLVNGLQLIGVSTPESM
jgi:arginyl-tRNA synthetase